MFCAFHSARAVSCMNSVYVRSNLKMGHQIDDDPSISMYEHPWILIRPYLRAQAKLEVPVHTATCSWRVLFISGVSNRFLTMGQGNCPRFCNCELEVRRAMQNYNILNTSGGDHESNLPSFCGLIIFYSCGIYVSLCCRAFIEHLLLGGHASAADSERPLV